MITHLNVSYDSVCCVISFYSKIKQYGRNSGTVCLAILLNSHTIYRIIRGVYYFVNSHAHCDYTFRYVKEKERFYSIFSFRRSLVYRTLIYSYFNAFALFSEHVKNCLQTKSENIMLINN